MKMHILFSCFLLISLASLAQSGVAISSGVSTPAASAMLDVQSTSKGMLIPRMTSAQRTAIGSPANGLLVFDTTTESFWFFSGSWTELVDQTNSGWSQKVDTLSANKPLVGIGTTNPSRMLTLGFNNANINTSHMLFEQAGTGDAWFNLGLTGAKHYAIGLDNSDNDKFKIGFSASGPSGVHVNTRLTIDTLGNIGINASSPVSRLQVNSLVGQSPLRVDVAGSTKLLISSNGGTSIGSSTAPPSNGLYVSGSIYPAGGISSPGNITVTSTAGYVSFTAGGSEIRLYSTGQVDIIASGDLNLNAGGNLNLDAAGSLNIDAGGALGISGSSVGVQSISTVTVQSASDLVLDSDLDIEILSARHIDMINSSGTMNIRTTTGTMNVQTNSGTMNVKNIGGNLNVSSSSTLNLDGAEVDINNGTNGAARIFDPVSGGLILSGSSSVKIGN